MLIINTSSTKLEVKIDAPHGVDYVHLQPKGRATLEADHVVNANWKAQHGSSLRMIDDTPVNTAAVSTQVATRRVVASSSTTADKE